MPVKLINEFFINKLNLFLWFTSTHDRFCVNICKLLMNSFPIFINKQFAFLLTVVIVIYYFKYNELRFYGSKMIPVFGSWNRIEKIYEIQSFPLKN